MGQTELTDAIEAHMRKPGDPPLNPTGANGTRELRMTHKQIKTALLQKLDERCDIPGCEHLSWLEAGLTRLLQLYVACEPWAVKEVHNRAFGRVPLAVDASLTVSNERYDAMSIEELAQRAERLADLARQISGDSQ